MARSTSKTAPCRLTPMVHRSPKGVSAPPATAENSAEDAATWLRQQARWLANQHRLINELSAAENLTTGALYARGGTGEKAAATAVVQAADAFLADRTEVRAEAVSTAIRHFRDLRNRDVFARGVRKEETTPVAHLLDSMPALPEAAFEQELIAPSEKERLGWLNDDLCGSMLREWLVPQSLLRYRSSRLDWRWDVGQDGRRVLCLLSPLQKPATSLQSRWEQYAAQRMAPEAEKLDRIFERAVRRWFQEADAGNWEWTPMLGRVYGLGSTHPEAQQGWVGQPAACGPLSLDLPRTRAWLATDPDLERVVVETSTATGAPRPIQEAFWESWPRLGEADTVLERLRKMTTAQMRSLFKNPGLGAEGLRLVRNWAVFHLLQVGGNNRFVVGSALPAEVLNNLAAAGHPLSDEEMERFHHACSFSLSPDLRAGFAGVEQVVNAPWAEMQIFRKGKRGVEWAGDLLERALPLLEPERASRYIRACADHVGAPLPGWKWKEVLERVPADRIMAWDRKLVSKLLASPDREVRELMIRKMGEGVKSPEEFGSPQDEQPAGGRPTR